MRALRILPIIVLLLALGVTHPAAATTSVDVVASKLDSPGTWRSGRAGTCSWRRRAGVATGRASIGGEGPACMGATGAVTKIDRWGRKSRIVKGLASYANTPNNDNAIGPHGITVLGADQVYVTNGGPRNPRTRPARRFLGGPGRAEPGRGSFGRLLRIKHHGKIRKVADIWAFERDVNPDATVGNPAVDSNPVDVLFDRGRFVVADAGGNAIDVVDHRGPRQGTWRCSPNRLGPNPNPLGPGTTIPTQAVPTSVVARSGRRYYVSQLTGFPFPMGGANVWRVTRARLRPLRERVHQDHGPRVRQGRHALRARDRPQRAAVRVPRGRAVRRVPGRDQAADRPAP